MTKKELLQEAKNRFPVDTVVYLVAGDGSRANFKIEKDTFEKCEKCSTYGKIQNRISYVGLPGYFYYEEKWADIISKPEEKWVPKVGDWAVYISGNSSLKIGECYKITFSGEHNGCHKVMTKQLDDLYPGKEGWVYASDFRKAELHEIPVQKEERLPIPEYVEWIDNLGSERSGKYPYPEYVLCIKEPTSWVEKGRVYKCKYEDGKLHWLMEGPKAEKDRQNGQWDAFNDIDRFWKYFTTSTKQAYDAQFEKSLTELELWKIKAKYKFDSVKQLAYEINSNLDYNLFKQLEGKLSLDKAEILWKQWNPNEYEHCDVNGVVLEVGDTVKCVISKKGSIGGSGWSLNKEFVIEKIYKYSTGSVAFPKSGNGVYFYALEFVSRPLFDSLKLKEQKEHITNIEYPYVPKECIQSQEILIPKKDGRIDPSVSQIKSIEIKLIKPKKVIYF